MNTRTLTLILATFLSPLLAAQALAKCPQLEGKYTYECMVKRYTEDTFAEVLDSSGYMLVQQTGCDTYRFENLSRPDVGVIQLVSGGTDAYTDVKIKHSTQKSLRFKTVTYGSDVVEALSLYSEVFKGSIRKTSKGFKLRGTEKSRFFVIHGERNSKFSCRFIQD